MVVNLEQGAAGDKTLLVVDDDRVIRGLVADVMGKLGYEVICVESAEEGVPILEKRMVSVALVDIHLPGMSGMELLRRFSGESSVSIIMFTGDGGTYTYEQAIHAGAADFLEKPVRIPELSLRIAKALETRRMRMAQERLVDKLEQLAITDELTGLFNRRRLTERMRQEVKRAQRYGRPIVILAVDIDSFKELNDSFGDAAGDAALQALGSLLRTDVRTQDQSFRIGGDEFMVLLPEITLHDGVNLAERLREKIHGIRLGGYPQLRLTASIGAAEYSSGESPAQLLERADGALYAAKRAGRNRVVALPASSTVAESDEAT